MNPISSNGQDNKGQSSFFVQKSEKLATAVYMITDIVDAREPLRWKIREEAMEILSLSNAETADASMRSNVLYRISQAIERVLHILTLARNTKLISNMNATIVMKEYSDLKERITDAWSVDMEGQAPRLDHRFFRIEHSPRQIDQRSFPQHETKRTSDAQIRPIGHSVAESQKTQSVINGPRTDKHTDNNGTEVSIRRDVLSVTDTNSKKGDRRSAILELLRTVPSVSVSDAMKHLPGVSDKTVQRELVAMVEAGILEKKGEKRWSTYSLKS